MISLSPGRRRWLERLANEGPANRARGAVGYDCMHAGWTEWNYTVHGQPISVAEAKERLGDRWFDQVVCLGERITDAGRAALKAVG